MTENNNPPPRTTHSADVRSLLSERKPAAKKPAAPAPVSTYDFPDISLVPFDKMKVAERAKFIEALKKFVTLWRIIEAQKEGEEKAAVLEKEGAVLKHHKLKPADLERYISGGVTYKQNDQVREAQERKLIEVSCHLLDVDFHGLQQRMAAAKAAKDAPPETLSSADSHIVGGIEFTVPPPKPEKKPDPKGVMLDDSGVTPVAEDLLGNGKL